MSPEDRAQCERWERAVDEAQNRAARAEARLAPLLAEVKDARDRIAEWNRRCIIHHRWNENRTHLNLRVQGYHLDSEALLYLWLQWARELRKVYEDDACYNYDLPWPRALEEVIEAAASIVPTGESDERGDHIRPWLERLRSDAAAEERERGSGIGHE